MNPALLYNLFFSKLSQREPGSKADGANKCKKTKFFFIKIFFTKNLWDQNFVLTNIFFKTKTVYNEKCFVKKNLRSSSLGPFWPPAPFLGSSSGRGRSPVELGEILSVCLSVCPYIPPRAGHQAPLAGPLTPPAGPQTPLATPQTGRGRSPVEWGDFLSVHPSVRRSVRPSVGPSVRRSVTCFFFKCQKWTFSLWKSSGQSNFDIAESA